MAPLATAFVRLRADSSLLAAEATRDAAAAGERAGAAMGTRMSAGLSRTFKAVVGIGAATGLVEAGRKVVELADQFEGARSRVEQNTENIGIAFGSVQKPLDGLDSRMAAFGFTVTDTENAFAQLVTATRNPTKALTDVGLAADIARGRHIGLDQATQILMRVETGHVAMLGRLGIATRDASGHIFTQQQALEALAQAYGGNASRFAGTFAGKQAAARAEMQLAATQIGVALLPALADLANVMAHDVLPPIASAAKFFDRNRKTIEPLVKVAAELTLAWKAYSIATKIATAMTREFGGAALVTAGQLETEAKAERDAATSSPRSGGFGGKGLVPGIALTVGSQFVPGDIGKNLSAAGQGAMLGGMIAGLPGAAVGAVAAGGAQAASNITNDANRATQANIAALAGQGPAGVAMLQKIQATAQNLEKQIGGGGQGGVVKKLDQWATEALKAAGAESTLTSATKNATTVENTYGAAIQRTAAQIASHAQKTINFKSAQDAVRQAMHDAAQTAADNGRALTGNSDAALANRGALMNQATAVLNVIDVMKQNGSSAANQSTMLDILTQAVKNNADKIYGNRDAVKQLLAQLGLVPDAVDNAAAALATLPAVTQAAFSGDNVTPGAIHQLNQAVTRAKDHGKKVAQSFTDGYTPVVAKVPKAASDAANKAADAFNTLKDQMKSDLQSIASAVDSTRSSVAGFADFAAQGTDALGASGTNTDVAGQLKAKASKLEQFARLFNQLDRAGLDAHLMAQFAQTGPDAIPAMQALLHSGKRGIGQVNRIEQRIQTAAGSVATTSAAEQFSGKIHDDLVKLPDKLERPFKRALQGLHIPLDIRAVDRRNGIAVVISP